MGTPLKVLIVEDSNDDAVLLVRELRRAGYDPTFEQVDDAEGMKAALAKEAWDVITCDFSMHPFDGMAALELLRESGLDTPLIIVSGTIGEDTAVAALHAGAADFLVKGNLLRLRPAIERAMREAATRVARREAEAALSASERRMNCLWNSGIVGISIADEKGKLYEANPAFLSMVGREPSSLDTLTWTDILPPEFAESRAAAGEELRRTGHTHPTELEVVRGDGSRVPALIAAATLSPTRNIVISLDQSDRQRLEDQYRRAQKLEAVGRVVGGVAHEFNNLLSVILGYADLVLGGLPAHDPLRHDIAEIKTAGTHAADLTRQLLGFGRQQVIQPENLHLNNVVTGMERMLKRLLGAEVMLSLSLDPQLASVRADSGHMQQIVLNLAVNARDAMPHGGRLMIETANATLDAEYARTHAGVTPGPYVKLTVSDQGEGMDAATQSHMFEPFFTTKERGKGTGLGLWVVFGIVQQNGGHMTVRSARGKGTTFDIYLPRAEGVTADAQPPSTPEAIGGNETILLVEDDDQVRAVARGILRRVGYNVLEAPNGGEALLICEKHSSKIDLLLSDLVLPHMNGRELAERLAKIRPDMRVLYMSGYTDDEVVREGVLNADVAFLQKPFTPDSLARKVRDVLG